ncbi:hypothetical protein LTS18_014890, partial [Coniosporium uncinatum]
MVSDPTIFEPSTADHDAPVTPPSRDFASAIATGLGGAGFDPTAAVDESAGPVELDREELYQMSKSNKNKKGKKNRASTPLVEERVLDEVESPRREERGMINEPLATDARSEQDKNELALSEADQQLESRPTTPPTTVRDLPDFHSGLATPPSDSAYDTVHHDVEARDLGSAVDRATGSVEPTPAYSVDAFPQPPSIPPVHEVVSDHVNSLKTEASSRAEQESNLRAEHKSSQERPESATREDDEWDVGSKKKSKKEKKSRVTHVDDALMAAGVGATVMAAAGGLADRKYGVATSVGAEKEPEDYFASYTTKKSKKGKKGRKTSEPTTPAAQPGRFADPATPDLEENRHANQRQPSLADLMPPEDSIKP